MKSIIHVLDKDKRKRKRVELFSNIQAHLEILGASSAVTIKDVSYSGFGLLVPPNTNMSAIESLEAKLSILNQDFKGTVANKIILPNQQIKIGFSLPQQIQREIDFNLQDPSWDRVTDAETIQNIYQDLAFKGPEAPIELKQKFSRATLNPIEMTNSGGMICEFIQIHHGSFDKGKAKCTFDLFQTSHAFETNIEKIDQNKVELKLSNTLARLLRREAVRVLKHKSTFDLTIRLRSDSIGKEISEFEVYDYSEHGLSLKDPDGNLSLPRNLHFEEAVVEIKNIGVVVGRAEVRSYEWNREQNAYIIGLLFDPGQEPNLTNWHNFILKARYPNLDFEYQKEDHPKIWNLFEGSGYLNHLDKNQTENLSLRREESIDTWKKLKDSGVGNSRRIMYKKDENVSGHLQLDQYYKDSWCVHHLAISKDSSKIIAKDIYSAMTDFLSSRNTKYIITYHRPDLAWNQRNYHDFVKNYQYKNHNYMELFNLYDFQFQDIKNNEKSHEKIRVANEFDLKSIYNFYQNTYPSFVLEALNIDAEKMKLEILEEEFEKVKLTRGREYFVYSEGKKIKAFLQVEWGTHATNIFSLFDSIFVYIIEPIEKEQLIEFLRSAGDFLKQKGKTNALVLIRDEYKVDLSSDNMGYLCNENRWIAKSATLKRYQAYAQILYGHLVLRREKIRTKIDKKNKNENN